MRLENIQQISGKSTSSKRVGRGFGSGRGAKSGRGQKGQKSRTGFSSKFQFEGGQTSFIQKMPKRKGFKNPFSVTFQVINLSDLEKNFNDGEKVELLQLLEKNLVRKISMPVKLLGKGELTKKIEVSVDAVSVSAKEKVEKLGGKVSLISNK